MDHCESKNHGWAGVLLFVNLAQLVPGEGAARLVFNHTGFKEIAFLFQVDHLAHPGERVFLVREQRL